MQATGLGFSRARSFFSGRLVIDEALVITIQGKEIILLFTVDSISPGHNRKAVLFMAITCEGDSAGLHPLLLEGEGALLEGNKYLLGCHIDNIFILLAVNKHSFSEECLGISGRHNEIAMKRD